MVDSAVYVNRVKSRGDSIVISLSSFSHINRAGTSMITEKIKLLACAMIVASTALSATASAETNGWYVEGQYTFFDIDDAGLSAELGALGFVAGRDLTENFAIEFVAGFGAGDDDIDGLKIEVDRYFGLVLKPNIDLNEQINIFLDLGYVDLQLGASGFGQSIKDSSSEFLWGVGAEIDFNDSVYGSIGYSNIDTADGIQVGIGYRF